MDVIGHIDIAPILETMEAVRGQLEQQALWSSLALVPPDVAIVFPGSVAHDDTSTRAMWTYSALLSQIDYFKAGE